MRIIRCEHSGNCGFACECISSESEFVISHTSKEGNFPIIAAAAVMKAFILYLFTSVDPSILFLATTPGNSSFTCRHFQQKTNFYFSPLKIRLTCDVQPVITISSIKFRAIRHASGLELPNSKYTSQKLPLWALPIFLENPRHFIHELSAFGRWR